MRRIRLVGAAIAVAAVALSGCAASGGTGGTGGGTVTLSLQSWRVEDAPMWKSKIIPAFEKTHPGIKVKYEPTATTEFDAAVDSRMKGGTAGDLILCRPYDVTRTNIKRGYFAKIDDLAGTKQFDPAQFEAWGIGDGHNYCMPMAAIYGLVYYNKKIFSELNLQVPKTHAEFLDALKAVKKDGKYEAIALGSADPWVLSGNGVDIIGAPYWKGEQGRQGLLSGTAKFTDADFIAGIQAYGDLRPYLPKGFESLTYADQMQLYGSGKAATWITGSWEINTASTAGMQSGAFAAPVPAAGDGTYLQVHPDMAMGVNANGKHQKEAKIFLDWVSGDEFLSVFTNSLPGFFSLTKNPPPVDNALAKEMAVLAKDAAGWTPRLAIDRLSNGNPSLENEKQRLMQVYMNDPSKTAQWVAQELQKVLETTYTPPSK